MSRPLPLKKEHKLLEPKWLRNPTVKFVISENLNALLHCTFYSFRNKTLLEGSVTRLTASPIVRLRAYSEISSLIDGRMHELGSDSTGVRFRLLIAKSISEFQVIMMNNAFRCGHVRESWNVARQCTGTGKGSKRIWTKAPSTSNPDAEETEEELLAKKEYLHVA